MRGKRVKWLRGIAKEFQMDYKKLKKFYKLRRQYVPSR